MSNDRHGDAAGNPLRVGYFVETPITREKRMYGAQLSLVSMVAQLGHLGVDPFVVVSEEWEMTDALREMGVPVLITPIWEFFRSLDGVYADVHDPSWVAEQERLSEMKVRDFFEANDVQLVHMNTRFAGLLGARVARQLGLPYVFHIREFLADDFGLAFQDEAVAKDLLSGASSLIAISQAVRESLEVEYPSARVEVVYNGVDVEKYRYDAPARFAGPAVRVALVGRVVEHKGQFEAIRAVEALAETSARKVELSIIGYRPDELTPYEQSLLDYVDAHALHDVVKFVAFTSDVPSLLQGFDIGLMCSGKEAFGRVTVEYMLSRLLVVGSATGGTAELVADGVDGLLYRAGDHNDLARKLAAAVNDPEAGNAMIDAAYIKAAREFPTELNARRVREVYGRAIGGDRGGVDGFVGREAQADPSDPDLD